MMPNDTIVIALANVENGAKYFRFLTYTNRHRREIFIIFIEFWLAVKIYCTYPIDQDQWQQNDQHKQTDVSRFGSVIIGNGFYVC